MQTVPKTKIFLFSFWASPNPVWLEVKLEWPFLTFWFFLLFFKNVLVMLQNEFFFPFLACPSSIWLEMKLEWLLKFFEFFYYIYIYFFFLNFFWECSILGLGETIPKTKFFLFSFLTYPDPIWLEMKPEWRFLNFWIFFF